MVGDIKLDIDVGKFIDSADAAVKGWLDRFATNAEKRQRTQAALEHLDSMLRKDEWVGTRVMALDIADDSPNSKATRELLLTLKARPNHKLGGKDTWTKETYWPKK
jgi:hypothetical protein